MFGEQARNAKTASKLGLARIINKFNLTKENLLNAILEVNIFLFEILKIFKFFSDITKR